MIHHAEDINSSKKTFRACVKAEVCTLEEGEVLIDMADDRNETVHTYSVEASRIILADVPRYYSIMIAIIKRLQKETPAL